MYKLVGVCVYTFDITQRYFHKHSFPQKRTIPDRTLVHAKSDCRAKFYYQSYKPSFSIIDNADYGASRVRISGGIYELTF